MRLEQRFHWNSPESYGTSTSTLVLPFDAPASLRAGTWVVNWTRGDYRAGDRLELVWKGVKATSRFERLHLEVLQDESKQWSGSFTLLNFPSREDGSILLEFAPLTHFHCGVRFVLTIEGDGEADTGLVVSNELAKRFAALSTAQVPHDVLLHFPRCGRQIWTSESVLRCSPYFRSLLSSDFVEASTNGQKATSEEPVNPLPFDDSDDEEDAVETKASSAAIAASAGPHKTVVITDAAYSTYLAVICCMQSGQIDFKRLSSSASVAVPTTPSRKPRWFRKLLRAHKFKLPVVIPFDEQQVPSPFVPVSPKSVYRLAHLLELHPLSTLALNEFSSQLTVPNAAHELFSEMSGCYDEICQAAVEFVVKYSDQVCATDAWKEAEGRTANGTQAEWEAGVWAKLAVEFGKKK